MVLWKGMPRATDEERVWLARIKQLPCCLCLPGEQKSVTEVHHIKIGNKRAGHFYVLPLCKEEHHANVHRYKQFERALWDKLNQELGVTREWPDTKIVGRAGYGGT